MHFGASAFDNVGHGFWYSALTFGALVDFVIPNCRIAHSIRKLHPCFACT